MRASLVVLIAAAALIAPATAAFAEQVITTPSVMQPPPPTAMGTVDGLAGADLRNTQAVIPDPYYRKLAFLQHRLLVTKAKDGGRLTPAHAAALQAQLDKVNREEAALRRE